MNEVQGVGVKECLSKNGYMVDFMVFIFEKILKFMEITLLKNFTNGPWSMK